MDDKRIISFGPPTKRKISWSVIPSNSWTASEIVIGEPDPRCHCHTHHRFCCLANTKINEESLNRNSCTKRESQDPKESKGKLRGKRSRSHHRRRRLKKAMERISKTWR